MQGKTSSDLTKERQNRILFADYSIQKQRFESGCASRIQLTSGSGSDNASSTYTKIVDGTALTTPEQQAIFLANNTCPPPPPTGPGSMNFAVGQYLSFANDTNLLIGTSSFTIEWFQYRIAGTSFPRVFSIGTYTSNNTSIAVSLESGRFYFWRGMTGVNVDVEPPLNQWVHVAVVGTGGTEIKIYVNGSQLGSTMATAYNFSDSTRALTIGNETVPTDIANFTGQLTNFRWVVGTAVYTGTFTPPTAPLTAISGTKLLLLASSPTNLVTDSSSDARSATNTGVTYNTRTPF